MVCIRAGLHELAGFVMASLSIEASSSVNHANDLLVITCASGKQVTALLPNLVQQWQRLRLVCNSLTSQRRLEEAYPKAEVTRADLSLRSEAERVLKDASVIYFVEPPFVPRQAAMGFNMVDAAKTVANDSVFRHFVYASVLNPQLRKVRTHQALSHCGV